MTATSKTLFFFLVAALHVSFTAAAQQKDTAKAIKRDTVIIERIIEREAPQEENSIDKSLQILELTASFFDKSLTVLSIILSIVAAFFIFIGLKEYREWKKMREEFGIKIKETEEKMEKVKEDANLITAMREKLEKETDALRKEMATKKIDLSSIEKPPEETKQKLNELGSKLEFLEEIGGKLTAEDYNSRGNDLYYKNKFDLALRAFQKAIELKPDFADSWNNKGFVLDELGQYEDALKAYDQAIKFKPDYAEALINKGVSLGKLERYKEALEVYDQAIKFKPDLETAWNNKGFALDELERYEEALEAYNQAIKFKPDYANAWINKGVSLNKLKRYDEAFKVFEKARELNPKYAPTWFNISCIYSLQKNKTLALQDLSKAIELNQKFKQDAKTDKDFQWLWEDDDFKKLVS
ncbi:MAG: tetratricopeptide repeat protein [Bacteroidia bacterium]